MTMYREPETHPLGTNDITDFFVEIEGEEEKFILDHAPENLNESPEGRMLLSYLEDEKEKAAVCKINLKGKQDDGVVTLGGRDFQALRSLSFLQYCRGAEQKTIATKTLLKAALSFEEHMGETLQKLSSQLGNPERLSYLIDRTEDTAKRLKIFLL